MRVLLVEDDEMIGESLREALRRQGFAADWVRDGRAADAVLASESFDAVLLDLGLPQRSGLEVGILRFDPATPEVGRAGRLL
jgi:DNA-binding response OmpR family regulator